MNRKIPCAVFWARRAGLALTLIAAAMYVAFFFSPETESETVTAAAAFWGMVSAYLIGIALLFTPTK
ncbi:MAG: hypothetical protein Q618_VCMC00001G0157 [Varibaculum cambriense DORA_20]|uniref:hypothetical protein n=1 Tax=Varibaculum cambriense TaxID=184870 RepID=UPI0003D5B8E4|nr:hypothetical protein [Varibaculum cambriense]ETI82576.1 MAG: hypothetical protein Q618_VCMC00001G0157 [Varibaculum cambriense DORA_20]